MGRPCLATGRWTNWGGCASAPFCAKFLVRNFSAAYNVMGPDSLGELRTPYLMPTAYTSPYAWIFWAVFLFAYVPEFKIIERSRPSPGATADRGSITLFMQAGWIGLMCDVWVAVRSLFEILH